MTAHKLKRQIKKHMKKADKNKKRRNVQFFALLKKNDYIIYKLRTSTGAELRN